jgi:DNA-binding MarR family transcriptional regulator
VCVPSVASSVDFASLASRLRTGVWRLARRLRSEADVDLSPTLQAALGTLDRHGPMTPGAFARHEQIRKPTATRTIAALVERGLVERTPDPLDRRVSWLQLSSQGRRLLGRVRRRHDAFLAARLAALRPEELATLERAAGILERLTEGPGTPSEGPEG